MQDTEKGRWPGVGRGATGPVIGREAGGGGVGPGGHRAGGVFRP